MHWPFWLSGGAIGLFVVGFAWLTGKAVSVSTGYGCLCGLSSRLGFFKKKPYCEPWRLWFILGIPLGGLGGVALSKHLGWTTAMGSFDAAVGAALAQLGDGKIYGLVTVAGITLGTYLFGASRSKGP
jgi:hypothetical protein